MKQTQGPTASAQLKMNPTILIASVILLAYSVSCVPTTTNRDLVVEVINGRVRKKDTLSTDPYMSVTVCKDKQRTPTIRSSLNPVWNWKYTFKNVNQNCRLKFHLYDDDFGTDDTIGEFETTVGKYLNERTEQSTLTFGKKGDSNIQVKLKYLPK